MRAERRARPAAAARLRSTMRLAAVPVLLALGLQGCATPGQLEPMPELTAVDQALRNNESWLGLGRRLLAAGEYDLAQQAFERSLLHDGVSAQAMTGAGIAASQLGLYTMAARYFERARDLAPDSIVANNNLGVVLLRLEEYYPARQAFRTAFALSDGRNELAMRNLRLAELTVAEIESERDYVDPAVNFRLRRLGTHEFELVDYEGPVIDEEPVVGSDRPAAVVASPPGEAPPQQTE